MNCKRCKHQLPLLPASAETQTMQVWLYIHRFNRVKGIVTRKDLLGYKLDEAVQVLLTHASDGMRSCILMRCSACGHNAARYADVHRPQLLTCWRVRRALVLTSRGLSDCAAL